MTLIKMLIPTLKYFFQKHPLINPTVFLGDATFDTVPLYKELLIGDTFGKNKHFQYSYILLNTRAHLETTYYTINEHRIPCCSMKPEGSKNPCTDSKCGRMVYIYPEKNLQAYHGTIRETQE